MKVSELKRILNMFPDGMEILVQTCQGDLMQPLTKDLMWMTEAFIDERYKNLEASKLVITSYLTSDENIVRQKKEYINPRSGVLVKYEEQPSRD
jgi:hypothetical protein